MINKENQDLLNLKKENQELQENFKKMEEEMKNKLDEALILWAEVTEKKDKYKQILIVNNCEFEDSDEEESDEDDDDEDEDSEEE